MYALMESNYGLRVKKATNLALDGGCNLSSGDKATVSIHAGKIVLDAATSITLNVAGTNVVITSGQVFISPVTHEDTKGPGVPAIPASVPVPDKPDTADAGDELAPIPDPNPDSKS